MFDILRRCVPLPCNEYSNCDPNARCELSSKGTYECKCLPGLFRLLIFIFNYVIKKTGKNLKGFFGDGLICSTQSCDVLNNCGENAICSPDSLTLQYRCVCEYGFIGNGYSCIRDREKNNLEFHYTL